MKDDFEDSIQGSRELSFCELFSCLQIDDYIIRDNDHPSAVVSPGSLTKAFQQFLVNKGHSTSFKSIEVIDYNNGYDVLYNGYKESVVLFSTTWLEYEKPGGIQYRYLFEKSLPITFSKFF